jgi:hypothetical protein
MLSWIAAVLFAEKGVTARQARQRYRRVSLDGLTRMVIHLIIVRAGDLAPRRPRKLRFWKHGRAVRRRHFMRSVAGSRLRRALRHKDPAARIVKLIAALRNLDAYTQLLPGRLTRLWAITATPPQAEILHGAPAPAPGFANSS